MPILNRGIFRKYESIFSSHKEPRLDLLKVEHRDINHNKKIYRWDNVFHLSGPEGEPRLRMNLIVKFQL